MQIHKQGNPKTLNLNSIAEAFGDRRWIGLLNAKLGLQTYLARLASVGLVYGNIIVASGSAMRIIFGPANVDNETSFYMRGEDYITALRDPKGHITDQLPQRPRIWEFNVGEIVSDLSSQRLNPLGGVLTFGDWWGVFGSDRYSSVVPDRVKGIGLLVLFSCPWRQIFDLHPLI